MRVINIISKCNALAQKQVQLVTMPVQLVLSVKGCAIKGLSFYNSLDIRALDLLSDPLKYES